MIAKYKNLYNFHFDYDCESSKLSVEEYVLNSLDYFPEYTLNRTVNNIDDAFSDMCSRVKQYILDENFRDRTYLSNNFISIYLRKNFSRNRLELARIEIFNKEHQGKNFGTNLINYIHDINSVFFITLLECISNPYLLKWSKNNNWKNFEFEKNQKSTSYYKKRHNIKLD